MTKTIAQATNDVQKARDYLAQVRAKGDDETRALADLAQADKDLHDAIEATL